MNKIWLDYYQLGVSAEINPLQYRSLSQLIEESCEQHAEKIAYVNLGSTLSYKALNQKSIHFGSYLQGLGLKKGARVALMMPNVLQYPLALFGILRAGFVAVNTNPLYTVDEVIHQLKDSGAEAILILSHFAKTLEKALPALPKLKHIIITDIADLFPGLKRLIVHAVIKYVKKMIPPFNIKGAIPFRTTLKEGEKMPFKVPNLGSEDLAFLQYTGGTTGLSKGAILTHGNMVANVLQAQAWLSPIERQQQDILITALPLYHIFSLTANCLTFTKNGAKNILITNPKDLPAFIKQIKNSKFTFITGVNTLFNALLNHPEFSSIDFSHLKLALSGGMSLQRSVALKWQEKTQAPILEAYGLTECSPAVTINPLYLTVYNGSIGLPLPSTEISIRNDKEKEVALGEIGELCIKGPQVMKGYWNHPEETAAVFTTDHFLKTGDIARMDEKGFIYLIDRKKDLIIVSGFNVYPNEVEQVISMHPGVLEVGVIGVKNEKAQEVVKACIVKRDAQLKAEDILQHCKAHLTAYKIPKIIEFYEELPKTNVGKILRRGLKQALPSLSH